MATPLRLPFGMTPQSRTPRPDAQTPDIRDEVLGLLGGGLTQAAVAERVGVSQSTVSRIAATSIAGERERGPVEDALIVMLGSIGELDPTGRARAQAARALARRLDAMGGSRSAASGNAAASLAREYNKLLDELSVDRRRDPDALDQLGARRAARRARLREASANGNGHAGAWT